MVFNHIHDTVNAAVNSAAVVSLFTEIISSRNFMIFCHMNRMGNQFMNTLVADCGNRYNRNLEDFLHFIDADMAAVSFHFIHHVQCDNHRNAEFHQLHCQIQIAFNICCVNDIDNRGRLFFKDEFSRYNLFTGIRRKRIDTRKVDNFCIGIAADFTALAVNRNTREIADMLVGTGQLIEQGCLAAVLVSCKRKDKLFPF